MHKSYILYFLYILLPKAPNHFDYRTIANVLTTIEYTALNSFSYRQQVIQTFKPTVSADRPFSFRSEFADQWYDLHNPDQTATPLTINFKVLREDFPPNLNDIRIEHVVMYFARSSDAEFDEWKFAMPKVSTWAIRQRLKQMEIARKLVCGSVA